MKYILMTVIFLSLGNTTFAANPASEKGSKTAASMPAAKEYTEAEIERTRQTIGDLRQMLGKINFLLQGPFGTDDLGLTERLEILNSRGHEEYWNEFKTEAERFLGWFEKAKKTLG